MLTNVDLELNRLITNKSVAIVGNAESLYRMSYAEEIDSHDVVIRMNRPGSFYVDMHPDVTCGHKITLWAFFDKDWFGKANELVSSNDPAIAAFRDGAFNMLDFKTHREESGHCQLNGEDCLFGFNTDVRHHLNDRRPSTGYQVMYMLSRMMPKSVDVYGIDFKKTPTFSEPHKFSKIRGEGRDRYDAECQHIYGIEEEMAMNHFFNRPNWTLR